MVIPADAETREKLEEIERELAKLRFRAGDGRRIVALDTGFGAELEPNGRVTAEFSDRPPQGK